MSMDELQIVQVVNDCPFPIRVYLRYPRPKKKSAKLMDSLEIPPKTKSTQIPRNYLVGAKDWEKLQARKCVRIETVVGHKPPYVKLTNRTKNDLHFKVKLKRKKATTAFKVRPSKMSRKVSMESISDQGRLSRLIKQKKLAAFPVYEIGLAKGARRSMGYYTDEDLYVCYKCGGAIVFRGSPPMPVHV